MIEKLMKQNDFFLHPALIKKINDGKLKNFDDNFGSFFYLIFWRGLLMKTLYWIYF